MRTLMHNPMKENPFRFLVACCGVLYVAIALKGVHVEPYSLFIAAGCFGLLSLRVKR